MKTEKPSQQQIRFAVRKLLADHRYKSRTKEFQIAIHQYDAPTLAARRLEQLAATKQLVFRAEPGQTHLERQIKAFSQLMFSRN